MVKGLCLKSRSINSSPIRKWCLRWSREDLAGLVLQVLNSLAKKNSDRISRYNFNLLHTVRDYPHEFKEKIRRALMEGWVWLEREGLLAPIPGEHGEWVFITRRAQQLATSEEFLKYQHANVLPRRLLHPRIAQKVWAVFLRGDYDTAVFQAFKEVEGGVRQAGKYADAEMGITLMQKAFQKGSGPLADQSETEAEQHALAQLFAGAIGTYKNPGSHWQGPIDAPQARRDDHSGKSFIGHRGPASWRTIIKGLAPGPKCNGNGRF